MKFSQKKSDFFIIVCLSWLNVVLTVPCVSSAVPEMGNWTRLSHLDTDITNCPMLLPECIKTPSPWKARKDFGSTLDSTGKVWTFGGTAVVLTLDGARVSYDMSDLWSFDTDIRQWILVHGDDTFNLRASFETKGRFSPSNRPSSRSFHSLTFVSGNIQFLSGHPSQGNKVGSLILFGGFGISSSGYLCDIWIFDLLLKQWAYWNGLTSACTSGSYPSLSADILATLRPSDSANLLAGIDNPVVSAYPSGRTDFGMTYSKASKSLWMMGGRVPIARTRMSTLSSELWQFDLISGRWIYFNFTSPNDANSKPVSRMNAGWTALDSTAVDGRVNFRLVLFGGNCDVIEGKCFLKDLWSFKLVHEKITAPGFNGSVSLGFWSFLGDGSAIPRTLSSAPNDSITVGSGSNQMRIIPRSQFSRVLWPDSRQFPALLSHQKSGHVYLVGGRLQSNEGPLISRSVWVLNHSIFADGGESIVMWSRVDADVNVNSDNGTWTVEIKESDAYECYDKSKTAVSALDRLKSAFLYSATNNQVFVLGGSRFADGCSERLLDDVWSATIKPLCPIGKYPSKNECIDCAEGLTKVWRGNESCLPCPDGSFSCTRTSFKCDVDYIKSQDLRSCQQCNPGFYNPIADTPTCRPCPQNAVCQSGKYSCLPYFSRNTKQECVKCSLPNAFFSTVDGSPVFFEASPGMIYCKCPSGFSCTKTPVVSTISPAASDTGGEDLYIRGENFDVDPSKISVLMIDYIDGRVVNCPQVSVISDKILSCKTPKKSNGVYYIHVQTGTQRSLKEDAIYRIGPNTIPPKTFDVLFNTTQNTPIILDFTSKTVIYSVNNLNSISLMIISLPSLGVLSQYVNGVDSDRVSREGSIIPIGNLQLLYRPFKNKFGIDSFQYLAIDSGLLKSNMSTVTVAVNSFDQAPEIVKPIMNVMIPWQRKLSKPFEVEILIDDFDELDQMSLQMLSFPTRGIWFEDANESKELKYQSSGLTINIPVSEGRKLGDPPLKIILYMKPDNIGGSNPYTEFTYRAKDSSGSLSKLTGIVKMSFDCSHSNEFLNNWSKGDPCKPCPIGAKCSITGDFFPANAAGYYPKNDFIFIPCVPPESCPETPPIAFNAKLNASLIYSEGFSCRDGYIGERCGECMPGYYRRNVQCLPCTQHNIPLAIIILAVVLLIIIALFVANILRKVDIGFFGILISYWQVLAIFGTFQLNWPEALNNIFHYFSFLYFNVELTRPECYMTNSSGMQYELRWALTMMEPILAFIVILMLIVASECYDSLKSCFVKKPAYIPEKQMKAVEGLEESKANNSSDENMIDSADTLAETEKNQRIRSEPTLEASDITHNLEGAVIPIKEQESRPVSTKHSSYMPIDTSISESCTKQSPSRSKIISTVSTSKTLHVVANPSMWNIVSGTYDDLSDDQLRELGGGTNIPLSISLFSVFLILLKMVYISVARRAMEFFDCSYNDAMNYHIFDAETSRKCFDTWWYDLLPYVIATIIIYVVGIPYLFVWLFQKRSKYLSIPFVERKNYQQFLLQVTYRKNNEFRPETEYWDAVLLIRKLAIVTCQLFFTKSVILESMAVILVFVIFLNPQYSVKPYALASLNRLEAGTMISNILVLMCGILFYVQGMKDSPDLVTIGYIVFGTIFLTSFSVLVCLVYHLKNLYQQFKRKRQKMKERRHQRADSKKAHSLAK